MENVEEEEGRGKVKVLMPKQDRCWIMLGKWSMGSITCLVLSEEEKKNEG